MCKWARSMGFCLESRGAETVLAIDKQVCGFVPFVVQHSLELAVFALYVIVLKNKWLIEYSGYLNLIAEMMCLSLFRASVTIGKSAKCTATWPLWTSTANESG